MTLDQYKTYKNFKAQVLAAAKLADLREKEAAEAGNADLEEKMRDLEAELVRDYLDLRAKEKKALLSTAKPVDTLRSVVSKAKGSIEKMERLDKALNGASEMISLIARVVALVA